MSLKYKIHSICAVVYYAVIPWFWIFTFIIGFVEVMSPFRKRAYNGFLQYRLGLLKCKGIYKGKNFPEILMHKKCFSKFGHFL